MKVKEFIIPAGMGGTMDFSYVKCGEYSVETVSPAYVINVDIKEVDKFGIKLDLKVSDNLENGLNVRNAIFALQHCGALN
jgi:hypothetical protein